MGNVHMEATQINYRGGSKKMSVEEAIKAAGTEITPEEKTWIDSIPALTSSNAGKTDQDVIAPEFDAEAGVYAVGDKVMYDGKLYKFTTAHETPGDWNITEVSETTVDDELSSLESGLTSLFSFTPTSFPTFPFTPTKNGFIVLVVEDQASSPSGECTVSVVDTYLNKSVALTAFTPVNQYDHCNSLMFPVIAGHTYTETFNKQTMSNTTWACSYWT